MNVVTALEAEAVEDGFYHLLAEEEGTKSLCGAVQSDDLFAGQVGDVVSRTKAEERGLQPCARCLAYADDQ